jgi:hypothetical protein
MIDEKDNYLKTDLLHEFHDLRRYYKLTKAIMKSIILLQGKNTDLSSSLYAICWKL